MLATEIIEEIWQHIYIYNASNIAKFIWPKAKVKIVSKSDKSSEKIGTF